MYPGLPSRLEHDLRARYMEEVAKGSKSHAAKLKLEIVDPPQRKHAVFEGASVIAGIYAQNDEYWISKAQYKEVRRAQGGASALLRAPPPSPARCPLTLCLTFSPIHSFFFALPTLARKTGGRC